VEREITLTQLLHDAIEVLRNALYHSLPGKVVAVQAGQSTVDVQIMVNDVRVNVDTGTLISEPFDVLRAVPIGYFKMGGLVVYADLDIGDAVQLIAQDLDPTAYRQTGQRSDPIDVSRHSGAYWYAVPFDVTQKGALPSANGAIVIGKPNPTDAAALASKVDSAVSTIVNAFNAHTHTGVTAGAGSSGPPATPISPSPGTTASQIVKIS
jgi:hypothetical protein